jgi:hypothetical protein
MDTELRPAPEARSPAEKSLHARIAAHISWAKTADPAARTAPARKKAAERFRRKIDEKHPELPEAQRAAMAEHARQAYFAALSLKSAQVRRARKRGSSC